MIRPHEVLSQILATIHPDNIPDDQRAAMAHLQLEVTQFIQQKYGLGGARVGDLFAVGGPMKGTDISLCCDLDLIVPFQYGYKTNPKGMKADLLHTLQAHFMGCTEVYDQRVSIGVRRLYGTYTLGIDVVPGMEKTLGGYCDAQADEAHKFLLLYDRQSAIVRATNFHRQVRLLNERIPEYRDTVRLLKAWRYKENHSIASYALELLVYRAVPDGPKAGGPDLLLKHVLRHSIPLLLANCKLQDLGSGLAWTDFLAPAAKFQLAIRWKKLLAALEGSDQSLLRSFFP